MLQSKNLVPVQGSEKTPLPGAHVVNKVDPNERIQVTVLVRRSHSAKRLTSIIEDLSAGKPQERKHLSRAEFAATHGADPEDLEKVEEFAHTNNLDIVEVNAAKRSVKLSGKASALSTAFGVDLAYYKHPRGTYRGRIGEVKVPENLSPIVTAVLGLDNRQQARPHSHILGEKGGTIKSRAVGISYTPLQIAELYNFPKDLDGSGQCIAIIELNTSNDDDPVPNNGTGYNTADLDAYFTQLGIPEPKIKAVSVDGGHNIPGINFGADGEVALDIEVAGAIAPGAQIVVYFTPNTDRGFIDAIAAAVHDDLNKPSVISISWGAAEKFFTSQTMREMCEVFKDAASLGVTICCSAGDHGSSDIVPGSPFDDNHLHVDFPGSCLYALACGGTRLEGTGNTITNEVVWNDNDGSWATGGGVSGFFDLPSWQTNANVPPSADPRGHIGRGVPDVAGNADSETGYQVLVNGQMSVFGGTSAVAPLWAGLIALFNQKLGKSVGYLNPVIYSLPGTAEAFHDITVGNNNIKGDNRAYQAGVGWDACTGLGSPDGEKLLSALSGQHMPEKKVTDARQAFVFPAKGVRQQFSEHKSGFEESIMAETTGGTAVVPPSSTEKAPRTPLSERFAMEEKQ
jgi:kumamolisin